jgi:hypothetical protein
MMKKVTSVLLVLKVVYYVIVLKNVQDAKKVSPYLWVLAHKSVQKDTIVLITLARNVKMVVLVVQVLINVMIVKMVLIYLKANALKNVQCNSLLKETNVSIVLIHALLAYLQMDAYNA